MSNSKKKALSISSGVIIPEWIDINGHMNVAYYVRAFDMAVDEQWAGLGITAEYITNNKASTFSVECHITYQRELKIDEEFYITSLILGYDAKRIHLFQKMFHKKKAFLAATAEWMNLHVDLDSRCVSEWPDNVFDTLREITINQQGEEYPEEAGKKMIIKKPIYSLHKE
jgi:acyl-CoA thioester hydrolase